MTAPNEDQPATGENDQPKPAPVKPPPAAKDKHDPKRKARSIHEAAHAVVGHEVGGTVNWINIDGHPDSKKGTRAQINWPRDPYTLKDVDQLNPAEIGPAREYVKGLVACFVAGDVAELAGTDRPLVSQRIPDHFWTFTEQPLEPSDRGMVAWLLMQVGLPDVGVVAAAEDRARAILEQRKVRHSYLVERLLETGYIEPPELTEALAK